MAKYLIITAFTIISLMGCNTEAKKTKIAEPPRPTTVQSKVEEAQPKLEMTQNYQVGSQVPTEQVCMVNDAFMGKLQIPVPVNGKTYYGCCHMCVKTLNENDNARTALDPLNKQMVDKAEAFIVLMGMDGKVAYFESEKNFLKFKEIGRMNH